MRLIRQLDDGGVAEQKVADRPFIKPKGCATCTSDNHAHKRAKVGPYQICRCLDCPVLVIE